MYGKDGPVMGHISALLADGSRTWANCEDPDVLIAMSREEFCGKPVRLAENVAYF